MSEQVATAAAAESPPMPWPVTAHPIRAAPSYSRPPLDPAKQPF